MQHAIVKSSELGTNCWLPVRFCGGRCQRVLDCKYPEKRTCKAVQTEIEYINAYTKAETEKLLDVQHRKLAILQESVK